MILESQLNDTPDLDPNQNDSASAAVNNQVPSVPGNGFYQPQFRKRKVQQHSSLLKTRTTCSYCWNMGLGGGNYEYFVQQRC